MACIRQKKGKARNARSKHCKVCSLTATLKLGIILSDSTLVTISFWGHYHGKAAAEQKDSPIFYICKNNSQDFFFSALRSQEGNTVFHDLNVRRRCWVLYRGCCLQFVQKGSMFHHTPHSEQATGSREMQQGWPVPPVPPVKEEYSLTADWLTSGPSAALNTAFTFLFHFMPISLVNKH